MFSETNKYIFTSYENLMLLLIILYKHISIFFHQYYNLNIYECDTLRKK